MALLSDYSTDELKRLSTLRDETSRKGEYTLCASVGWATLKTDNDQWVNAQGDTFGPNPAVTRRRVRSFTDLTEIDPPISAMKAEIERRKRPVISNLGHAGRRVQYVGTRGDWKGGPKGIILHPSEAKIIRDHYSPSDRTSVWWIDDEGSLHSNDPDYLKLL